MQKKEISIAPMLGYTNIEYRTLARFLGKNITLFTEMVKADEITKSFPQELCLSPNHFPTVAQIGGNSPRILGEWAKRIEEHEFSEININIGCPGKTTTQEGFGACLMQNSKLVEQIVTQVSLSVSIPVSIKCRIGINNEDSYEFFHRFIQTIYGVGCRKFYIHARKALLDGVTTHLQNRTIPPLRYDYVKKIKENYPDCFFVLNGGIKAPHCVEHLKSFDGIMIGREAYNNYNLIKYCDDLLEGKIDKSYLNRQPSKEQILSDYKKYLENFDLKKEALLKFIEFAKLYLSNKKNLI